MNNSLYLDLCVVRSQQDVNKPQITTLNHVEYQCYIIQRTKTKPTSEHLNDDKQILQRSGSYVEKNSCKYYCKILQSIFIPKSATDFLWSLHSAVRQRDSFISQMWNFTLERHKSLDHVQRAEADGSESEHSLPVAVDQLWHVLLTHLYPAILLHVVHWDKHTNKTDMNTQIHTVFDQSIYLLCMLCFYLNVWDMTGNEEDRDTGSDLSQSPL